MVDGSGHVYVAGADAVLHRIDVATGVEQGSVPTGSAFDAALAFSGGNVLIPTQQGSDPMALSSYDVTGGSLNWIRTVPGATDILSAPVVKGGTVYVATGDGKVVAVDTATGATRWTRQLSASISWGLEVHKDSIFVGTDDGNVWSLKTSDGSKIWKVKPSGATYWSTPTYFKKAVYLGSGSGALVGLDAATGSTKWSFVTAGDAQYNRPVIW